MPQEAEIISRMRRRSRPSDRVAVGIGDDAAVLRTRQGQDLLACCDLLVEGIHFRREWCEPAIIGRKALAVNLSDIAAMGGVPQHAMISVAFPPSSSMDFVESFFSGIQRLADETGVSIVGGDTSRSPGPLFIDISVIGECESGRHVSRAGARPGNLIYVSGALGGSKRGLEWLLQFDASTQSAANRNSRFFSEAAGLNESLASGFASRELSSINAAIRRHLWPEPRLKLGAELGSRRLATAMIDISDGLSTDLSHILEESGCGCLLRGASIPIATYLRNSAVPAHDEIDPLELALHGGEEYELLFTCDSSRVQEVEAVGASAGVTVTAIGEIRKEDGMHLERNGALVPLVPRGFQHTI